MKKLLIVGAGGFGRELLQWIKDINEVTPIWSIAGFLDDNMHALDALSSDVGIVSTINEYRPRENEELALAIAKPAVKEMIVAELKNRGAVFTRVLHPRAIICDTCKLGEGVVVYPNAIVGPNTHIGDFVTLLSSAVGHDVTIEECSTVSSYCDITGGSHIGKKAFLAGRVSLVPNTIIGDDAYIGVGSVVVRDVKPGGRVFGYPAKKMEF